MLDIFIGLGIFLLILVIGLCGLYTFHRRKMKRIITESGIQQKSDKKDNKKPTQYEPMMIEPMMTTDNNTNIDHDDHNNNKEVHITTEGQYVLPSQQTVGENGDNRDNNENDNVNLLSTKN